MFNQPVTLYGILGGQRWNLYSGFLYCNHAYVSVGSFFRPMYSKQPGFDHCSYHGMHAPQFNTW